MIHHSHRKLGAVQLPKKKVIRIFFASILSFPEAELRRPLIDVITNAFDFFGWGLGGNLFVSVASHLFILGIISSETHSGSCYYSYGRMGSLRTPSYPHQLHSHQLHSTLSPGETQVLSTNPRVPSPLRVAARPAGPAHVFKSTPDDCSATSSQRDFPKIIYIFSLAAISSPLPTHFIRSHIAVL